MAESLPAFGWSRLARNPETSPELLQSLARSGPRRIKIAVGQNASSTLTTLAYLALDHDSRVRESLANNPRTPSEILATLAHDTDPNVRSAISANPHAPVPSLVVLTRDRVTAVGERAKKNPQISERLDGFVRACTKSDDPHPRTAAEALACLVQDRGASTAKFVTTRWALDDVPAPEVLTVLAHSPDPKVQAGVARNKNTQPNALALLAMSKDSEVLRGVGANPNTPEATLHALSNPDAYYWRKGRPVLEVVQKEIAGNPSTGASTLAELATSPNLDVLKALARNPNAPSWAIPAIIDGLKEIPLPGSYGHWEPKEVLIAVGAHPNAPAGILQRLHRAGWSGWIAGNPNTPESTIREIADRADSDSNAFDNYGGPDWEQRMAARALREELASNPSTPAEILRNLFDQGYLKQVAANLHTPPSLLASYATELLTDLEKYSYPHANSSSPWCIYFDEEASLYQEWNLAPLEGLAGNPGTPSPTLVELAKFTERAESLNHLVEHEQFMSLMPDLRRIIAANPNTPAEVLENFLETDQVDIDDMPHASAHLRRRYTQDQDYLPGIRQKKARNHKTTQSTLRALAKEELGRSLGSTLSILPDIAANPNCPHEILTQLASHASADVRAAVARNSTAPTEALSILSTDSSREVRVALDLHHRFSLL